VKTYPNVICLPRQRVFYAFGIEDFIKRLLETGIEVAIWTSTTKHNGKPIIEGILDENIRRQLKFIWYRDQTELDPEFGISTDMTIEKHSTVKRIERILSHPYINSNREYNYDNVVIVDDTYQKCRLNPENCNIIVPAFTMFGIGEPREAELKEARDAERFDHIYSLILDRLSGDVIYSPRSNTGENRVE